MMGGGTGWVTTFRELLGNIGDATEFSTGGLLQSKPVDTEFRVAGLSANIAHDLWSPTTGFGTKFLSEKKEADAAVNWVKTLQWVGADLLLTSALF